MQGLYRLEEGWRPVRCESLREYVESQIGKEIRVGRDEWAHPDGAIIVSTVFLGIDHDHSGVGPPVLWETMIFASDPIIDRYCRRCAGSVEQAQAMHMEVVKHVRNTIQIDERTEATHRSWSGLHPRLD